MRAMLLTAQAPIEHHPLRLVELPQPIPAAGQLLVEIEACGVCRTDLHVIEGDLADPTLPLVPGHQIVGTVVAAPSGEVPCGARIGIAWLGYTCGECRWCRTGRENLCERSRYTGYHLPGGFAEYTVVNANYAYRLPGELSPIEAAPLLCAGIIGYRALIRSGIFHQPDAPSPRAIGFFGFGSSAHITLQIARHRGITVFVATRGSAHQQLARELGAAWTGELHEPLPEPVDSAIIFAPVGEAVPSALQALVKGGTAVCAGIHMSDIPSLNYQRHLFHEKVLTSVQSNTRADGAAFLAQAVSAGVRAHTQSWPLEEAHTALQLLKDGAIRGTAVLVVKNP